MNVLSVFDGMSCAQIALERAGVKVDEYYASEVDKYAIKVTQAHFPHTRQLGDISGVDPQDLPKIDLLIGGSPCQGFSFAGKQLNFKDDRSKLFFDFVRLFNALKPKYFLLENVKMKKEFQDIISKLLGVEPIEINSALVSAQNRKRLYWTNIPNVTQPEDKGIMLKDIVHEGEVDRDKSYCIDRSYYKGGARGAGLYFEKSRRQIVFETYAEYIVPYDKTFKILEAEVKRGKIKSYGSGLKVYQIHDKEVMMKVGSSEYLFGCITPDRVNKRQNGQRFNEGNKFYTLTAQDRHGILIEGYIRKLTPIECERLQTVPYGYTAHVSNTQRYKMLGNGFTVDVIAHILKGIKENEYEYEYDCKCEDKTKKFCGHCLVYTEFCNCNPYGTCMCS